MDAKLREYRLFRPGSLDSTKAVPLVVVLHPATVEASRFQDISHFDEEAVRAGFIAAYPNACTKFWLYAAGGSKLADLHFIEKLLDLVETDYRIDKARVFVVGFSAGAIMSYRLACDLSGRIAAIVSVGGSMFHDDCKPARPVSILEMHGTDDSLIPWGGGGSPPLDPVETVSQRWRTLDGCLGAAVVSQTGITKTSLWSHCASGSKVRLDAVAGGHHTWFGSELDPVSGEPDANLVIGTFLGSIQPTG